MDYDTWFDTFKPIKNPHDDNQMDGHAWYWYSGSSPDCEQVKKIKDTDYHYVWTVLDMEDCECEVKDERSSDGEHADYCDGPYAWVSKGLHWVNRDYYVICSVPWDDNSPDEIKY
jgi:hypothetical protein